MAVMSFRPQPETTPARQRMALTGLFAALTLTFAASPARADWVSAREAFWQQRADASRQLKELAQGPDTDPVTRRDAFHLLGRNERRLGHLGPAIAAFREAMSLGVGDKAPAPSAVADTIAFGLLEALVAARAAGENTLESPGEALALAQLIDNDPFSDHRPEAAFHFARHLELTGALTEAKAAYLAAKDRFPEATFLPELERRLAVLASPPAVSALDTEETRLASLATVPPPERRVPLILLREHLRERRFDLLTEGLAPWLVEPPPTASAEEQRAYEDALEILLQDQVENYRFPEALATNDKLRGRGRRGMSPIQKTRVHALDGQFDKARAELAKRFGKKSRAYHEALGDLAYEFARYEEAYDAWIKARGKKAAKNPTEQMVWALLRMGKANEAARHWESARSVRGRSRVYDRYWLARARQLAGRTAEARALFTNLAADVPLEYYGLQAASRLMELDDKVPTETAQPTSSVLKKGDEAPTRRSTIAWSEASLAGAFDQRLSPAPLQEVLTEAHRLAATWGEALPETARAAELVGLGDLSAAISELRVIDMDHRASKVRGQPLMNRTRSELLDNRSTPKARAGESLRSVHSRRTADGLALIKRKSGELREDLRRLQVLLGDPYATRRAVLENERFGPALIDARGKELYPIAYADVVEPLARQLGLPPYFVYAIMTVESAFHPGAVSVANAYGLVQVIPRTGDNLSRELGFVDFMPERLLEPSTSIYFGGYYLARLLSRFSGQEPLAAAAYNAGPHRVSTWLMARGTIPLDMFIEDIPYDQARAYTKRIFEHVAAYRRVYHGETDTYIRNTIDTKLGEGPNY